MVEIDTRLLEDLESANHPSEFQKAQDGHTLLILRLPEASEGELRVRSYAFVFRGKEGYRYDREKQKLVPLGSLEELHAYLDRKTDRLLEEIQRHHAAVDALEESLYDAALPREFIQAWLAYRKEVSLIQRLMFHAVIAFELFVRHYRKTEGFDPLDYADLLEHMGRIRDLAAAAGEKLDHLYDFYRAKVDERMNRNMYWLTILSAIFLPLTLVTGFFGMNTGGLPFVDDPDGTAIVTAISVALELLFLLLFIGINTKKIRKFRIERPK